MTEVRIFELLGCKSEFNKENPRLDPKNIKILSKYVADLIYSTKTSLKNSDLNRRLDTLKLVQEWSCSYAGPFKITPNNYGCLLKCLGSVLKSEVRGGCEFINCTPNIDGDYIEASTKSLRDEILEFNKLRCEKMVKREKLRAFVSDFDSELLCEHKFHQPIPNVRVINDCAPLIEVFMPENTDNERSINVDTSKIDLLKEKRANTICALVNINRTPDDTSVLEKIFGDLAKGDVLTPQEKAVVLHLWENNDANLDGLLLRHFKFLYEIVGVNACKKLLQDPEYVLANDSELWRIKMVVTDNTELRVDVKNMFYELFALGFYNENLLPVLDFF